MRPAHKAASCFADRAHSASSQPPGYDRAFSDDHNILPSPSIRPILRFVKRFLAELSHAFHGSQNAQRNVEELHENKNSFHRAFVLPLPDAYHMEGISQCPSHLYLDKFIPIHLIHSPPSELGAHIWIRERKKTGKIPSLVFFA